MPANVSSKITWLEGQISSRENWLADHGHKKCPEIDLEAKRYGLEMLQDIRNDYVKSVAAAEERAKRDTPQD